jgi:hypothetical protein
MTFKDKVTKLALDAGGVHYPEVNRMQLEVYTKLVINECIAALANTDRGNIVYTTFDKGQFDSTINEATKSIKESFGL